MCSQGYMFEYPAPPLNDSCMQLIFTEWLLHVKHGSKHGDKMMEKIPVFMEYFLFFFLVGEADKKL